jgi:hypothetical protein
VERRKKGWVGVTGRKGGDEEIRGWKGRCRKRRG